MHFLPVMMRKFWVRLWSYWALWVTLFSLGVAAILDLLLSVTLYVLKGMPTLNGAVLQALWDIGFFWFGILWSVTLLFGLLIVMKRLFGRCYNGWHMQLLTCNNAEVIEHVLLADVIKPWRKWLMLLIWGVALQILMLVGIGYMLQTLLQEWFNIYVLYVMVLISGFLSLPLLPNRCQRIQVVAC